MDADIDRLVSRIRARPIPRGAVTLSQAYIFTASESSIWLWMVRYLTEAWLQWSLPLIMGNVIYPYSKRLIRPVLGLCLRGSRSCGQLRLGIRQCVSSRSVPFTAYALLVTSVDMIYAHQDLLDDLKAGIGSMAVTFRGQPEIVLSSLPLLNISSPPDLRRLVHELQSCLPSDSNGRLRRYTGLDDFAVDSS